MSCRDVVDRWRARGHSVLVLTTTTRVPGIADAKHEVDIRRELEWYWRDHRFLHPTPRERLALERRNHRRLRDALNECRPDVVSVWHMGGMSLSLLPALDDVGLPMVLNVCDDWLDYGPKVDAWMAGWHRWSFLDPAVRRVTRVPICLSPRLAARAPASFVSDFTRRHAAAAGWSFGTSIVVGSGIDPNDFPIAAPRTRPWRWRLLCVGRVEPRKGFDVAVRAVELLPSEATLDIIGPADDRHGDELRALADTLDLGDRVRFGQVPRDQLASTYADADAVLFTSRWEEPFGLVPIEAMSQATPVIGTRQGGSAEFLVDHGNCLAVPVDDPRALAEAVVTLAGDEGLRASLVRGGLETASTYTVDRLAENLERFHLAATSAT